VYFSPTAQPISHKPAIKRYIHGIVSPLIGLSIAYQSAYRCPTIRQSK